MKVLGFITLTLYCIAAPLAAQDTTYARHPGMRPGTGREMMAPMMGVIAYTPGHLLAQKDSLKLTPDQVTKLTNIENSAKAAHETGAADFKTHMGAVSQAFQTAAPDTTALRPHFEAAHAAMGKAHWAMVAAAAQARAVLTDAQRQKVDAWVTMMQQRIQQEHTM